MIVVWAIVAIGVLCVRMIFTMANKQMQWRGYTTMNARCKWYHFSDWFLFDSPLEISNTKRANINFYTYGVSHSYSISVILSPLHAFFQLLSSIMSPAPICKWNFSPSFAPTEQWNHIRMRGKRIAIPFIAAALFVCLFILWKWIFLCNFLRLRFESESSSHHRLQTNLHGKCAHVGIMDSMRMATRRIIILC